MPKLTGIFEKFQDLDTVPVTEIISSLKIKGDTNLVQNFIGNRVLYPQTVASSAQDLELDHQILLEALKTHPEVIYDKGGKNIILTGEYTMRFPPFIKLMTTIIDAVEPEGPTGIFLKNTQTIRLGTIITSAMVKTALSQTENKNLTLQINGEVKNLTSGTINLLSYGRGELKLKFGSLEIIIPGGEMGIFLDLRGV